MVIISKLEFDKLLFEDTLIQSDSQYNKIIKLLESHKNLYHLSYKVEGNLNYFKKNINELVRNCLPNDFKSLKESHFRFKKLIRENNVDGNIINEFFDFLGSKIKTSMINEQVKQPAQQQKSKISPQITQYATGITKELMTALGADADDDEEMAVKAIKKINSKECLYEVDRMVKGYKRGKAPYSLQSLINSYMSDYNSTQYRAIWQHLGKFGVTGANYNSFLAGVGKGVQAVGKAFGKVGDYLAKSGIDGTMEYIRQILDSGIGQTIQILLDETGFGALGVMGLWATMTSYDAIRIPEKGVANFAFSAISLLSANALGPFLKPLKALFKTPIKNFRQFGAMLMKSKFAKTLMAWAPKLTGAVTTAIGWIKTAVTAFVKWLNKIVPGKWGAFITSGVEKASKFISDLITNLFTNSGDQAAKAAGGFIESPKIKQLMTSPTYGKYLKGLPAATEKMLDEYVLKNRDKYGWNKMTTALCGQFGDNSYACKAIKVMAVAATERVKSNSKQHLLGKVDDTAASLKNKFSDIKQSGQDVGNLTGAPGKTGQEYANPLADFTKEEG